MTDERLSILILDDEDLVRDNLIAFCEDEGFRVFAASSGEDALNILEKEKIDIGIVDMRLPGIDGNSVILRAHDIDRAMKFIIHTGSSTYSLPEELTRIGLDDRNILRKPIPDLDVLKEKILRCAREHEKDEQG